MRGRSENVLKYLTKNSFDVIFIDADHIYDEVKKDISHAIPLLKETGVISGHDCEANLNVLDKDLLSFIESKLDVGGILCEEIVNILGKELPDFNHIPREQYPFLTPLVKFRHIHCGVIKAVSETGMPTLYFAERRLNNLGFSSIWVAKRQSAIHRNKVFEKVKNFIEVGTESTV